MTTNITNKRGVLALDFDNTLVTDAPGETFLDWVKRVARETGQEVPRYHGIKDICVFQNKSFELLQNAGKTVSDVYAQANFKVETPGMKTMLETIREKLHMEVIVVSDNNSLIVSYVLDRLGLKHLVDHVFTNEATEDDSDLIMRVSPHHHLEEGECKYSFINLCKAKVISDFVQERKKHISSKNYLLAFAGDNINDLCPALLDEINLVFPRRGYPLRKELDKLGKDQIKAEIVQWSQGEEILKALEEKFKSL